MRHVTWSIAGAVFVAGCGAAPEGRGGGQTTTPTTNRVAGVRYDGLPDSQVMARGEFTLRTKWQKQDLTYFISNVSPDLDGQTQRQIIAQAFDTWAAVVPLNFTEVASAAQADFVIGFGEGGHCELYSVANTNCPADGAFDGPSGVLAHCYYPPGNGGGGASAGDMHFDDAERWSTDPTDPTSFLLLATAIHELGHGLGLDHNPEDPSAVMFPSYDAFNPKTALSPDDIAGVQALYGARDGSIPPSRPTMPPSDAPDVPTGVTPTAEDTDGDGLDDATELYVAGTDPQNRDTDGDGLIDYEVIFGLNPLNPDTDGDGASDGEEVANGTDPYRPDFGFGGDVAGFVGAYFGQDSFGSGLEMEVFDDGSVYATLNIMQYGFPTQVPMLGAVDGFGNVVMLSFDYFFVLYGTVGDGFAAGTLETAAGAVASWEVARLDGGFDDGFDDDGFDDDGFGDDDFFRSRAIGMPRADSSAYQPVRGQKVNPTHAVFQRVNWQSADDHTGHHHP